MVIGAGKVAIPGALDLDHASAVVGQVAGGEGSRYRLLHGNNFYAFER